VHTVVEADELARSRRHSWPQKSILLSEDPEREDARPEASIS